MGLNRTVDEHSVTITTHQGDIEKLPEFDTRLKEEITKLNFEQNKQRQALATTQASATEHLTELVN